MALALSVRSNRFQQHSTTNDRIESLNNGQMTFRYRKSGEQRDRVMTLPVFKFLRRIRAPPLNQRDT
ncbi:MAG: transposase, partial [Planctomycetota bacterium]|nr:transposase [Planctomycetota bacterium]